MLTSLRGNYYITILGRNLTTEIEFKNLAPFTKCIRKIN